MTSRFAKESRERKTSHKHPENQRKEHVDKRLDRGPKALNKYINHQEVDHRPRPQPPQYKEITPLNVSIAKVLVAIQDKNLLQWPQPLLTNPKTRNQYCQFHCTYGHDTNKYYQLRNEI